MDILIPPLLSNFRPPVTYLTAKFIMSYSIELPSEIYRVSRLTVSMKPEFLLYVMAGAIFVNFVAGLYPAWKASRMDPVEAISSL